MGADSSSRTIDIAVGGKFHANHLATAFLSAGMSPRVFTTYPASRFPDLSQDLIRSHLFPEIVYRIATRLKKQPWAEGFKMRRFGAWVSRRRLKESAKADVLFSWSGFALESFREMDRNRILIRDSAHIDHQYEVLRAEFERREIAFDFNLHALEREREEYRLADTIIVPSHYALRTFTSRGFSVDKMKVLPLAVDTGRFKPAPERALARPLKVVFFGFVSIHKGVPYLLEALESLPKGALELTLIGGMQPEMASVLSRHPSVKYVGAMSQADLANYITEMDIYVLPTLHDGFAMAVPQAMAAGLVPIVTDQCGAADLIESGKNGFIVPASDARALAEKLQMLLDSPQVFRSVREEVRRASYLREWSAYHRDVVAIAHDLFSRSSEVAPSKRALP